MKGKGSAEGKPIGEGETPCFALGFVVSPSHIGFPSAGVAQNKIGHKRGVTKRKWNSQDAYFPAHTAVCVCFIQNLISMLFLQNPLTFHFKYGIIIKLADTGFDG